MRKPKIWNRYLAGLVILLFLCLPAWRVWADCKATIPSPGPTPISQDTSQFYAGVTCVTDVWKIPYNCPMGSSPPTNCAVCFNDDFYSSTTGNPGTWTYISSSCACFAEKPCNGAYTTTWTKTWPTTGSGLTPGLFYSVVRSAATYNGTGGCVGQGYAGWGFPFVFQAEAQ